VASRSQVEKRYDHIMRSNRWRVISCEYPYEESIATNSDHSCVTADFALLGAEVLLWGIRVECYGGGT
jgi:endonuclease/exonuclease/phosphatase family metal-dependent hydrolase